MAVYLVKKKHPAGTQGIADRMGVYWLKENKKKDDASIVELHL